MSKSQNILLMNRLQKSITVNQSQIILQAQKKSRKKYLLLALIPVILALIGFGLWKTYQPKEIELQGRVEAETVQVATKVPSRIEKIYVQEGDDVKKARRW